MPPRLFSVGILSSSLIFRSPDTGDNPPAPASPAPPAAEPEKPADGPAAPPAPAEPAAPQAKASVFDRARSYLQDRGELVNQITTLKGQVTTIEGQLATANATIATQNAELKDLRAGRDGLQAEVTRLEAGQKTVSQGVADRMASLGVPAKDLPATDDKAQGGAGSDEEKYNAWKKATGAEKTKLFRANKDAIDRHAVRLEKERSNRNV